MQFNEMLFAMAARFTLSERIEGGYVDDPDDRGRETKYGISKRSYPNVDIKNLTKKDAIEIYKRDYWDVNRTGEMPVTVGIVLFDSSVLFGPSRPSKWLQTACNLSRYGDIAVDGVIGPKTISAAMLASEASIVENMIAIRIKAHTDDVKENRKQIKFLRGWMNRISELLKYIAKIR